MIRALEYWTWMNNDASLGILKLGEASLEIFELGEMGFSLWSWNFEVSWDELGMLY